MARKLSLFRTLLFSLGIGGALVFGTGTALASGGSTVSECSDPAAVYTCLSWYDCKKTCERYGYSGIEAHCVDGCCYCELN